MSLAPRLAALLVPLLLASACSLRRVAIGGLASSLSGAAETFEREDDPELVREALPFALKAMEAVLLKEPENERLLAAAGAGFALYAGFVRADARALAPRDWARSEEVADRALALTLRGRDYALRALELRHPGIGARLKASPYDGAAEIGPDDLELAYLTGGTWGLAISLGKDEPALVADFDAVRALLARCLELDEAWRAGALHEALLVVDALPAAMGGSRERARGHYERALELSGGLRADLFVKAAESLALPAQDRAEFARLLGLALAVDLAAAPEARLANRLAQERARELLAQADELFLPPLE
jgi:predicted anti-sigma-YlaC factor YlaD